MPSLVQRRMGLDPAAAAALPRHQLAWSLTQAGTMLALLAAGVEEAAPELAFALALGLGATATAPRRAGRGLALTAAAAAAAWGVGLFGAADSTLALLVDSEAAATWARPGRDAAQVLVAGGIVGAGLPWLHGRDADGWSIAHCGLAGLACAGLGAWAGAALGGLVWTATGAAAVGALVCGLVASQALVVAALRQTSRERIPAAPVIQQSLPVDRQGPALSAAALDSELAALCPDPDTRDGLGEVAAWVYRLQWSLAGLDRELGSLGGIALEERIVEQTEAAVSAPDTITRERRLATVAHLERLRGHRSALLAEVQRTTALADYALAYLEEARVELALAHVQPGDHTPERLGTVLERLRSYSAERAAHRSVARELAVAAPAAS
jgi:hypothetical protein